MAFWVGVVVHELAFPESCLYRLKMASILISLSPRTVV